MRIMRQSGLKTSLSVFVTAALLIASIKAQDSFLESPTRKWQVTVPPMGEGNAIVMEPDDMAVFATSSDATISALDPDDGNVTWTYQPPGANNSVPLLSTSGVVFSKDKKFMVYSFTEGAGGEDAIWCVAA